MYQCILHSFENDEQRKSRGIWIGVENERKGLRGVKNGLWRQQCKISRGWEKKIYIKDH